MYLAVGLGGLCMLAAIVQQLFPLWLGLALLVSIAISVWVRPRADMRGTQAVEITGAAQIPALLAVNLTVVIWLGQVLVMQVFFA
jgi:hypothetical protein